jgi:hypothetical protein
VAEVVRAPNGSLGMPFAFGVPELPGYVLEEFIVRGEAAAHRHQDRSAPSADGRWLIEVDRRAPYATRMLVLRPTDPAQYGGTVVVNWQNVTSGFELASVPEDLVEAGAAWVGVSAQAVGLDGFLGMPSVALRAWDPQRYESLAHPGDDFSFDIFSQVARLVGGDRDVGSFDPLAGLTVTHLLATGTSQSALRLRTYVNAVQPMEHLFDGFLLLLDVGAGALVDTRDCDRSVPLRIPHCAAQIRTDLDVPVFVVNSESEVARTYAVRQPDSELFRLWEVAGVAHVEERFSVEARRSEFERFKIPEWAVPDVRGEDANTLSLVPVQRAAFHHMMQWLGHNGDPPSLPLVEVEVDDEDVPVIRRDADGNALGGVRLPELNAPLGTHVGLRDGESDMLRRIAGSSRSFPPALLRKRYGTVEQYMRRYLDALESSISAGYILPDDRAALAARSSAIANKQFT